MNLKIKALLDWIRTGQEVFNGNMSVRRVWNDPARVGEVSKEEHEEHINLVK